MHGSCAHAALLHAEVPEGWWLDIRGVRPKVRDAPVHALVRRVDESLRRY